MFMIERCVCVWVCACVSCKEEWLTARWSGEGFVPDPIFIWFSLRRGLRPSLQFTSVCVKERERELADYAFSMFLSGEPLSFKHKHLVNAYVLFFHNQSSVQQAIISSRFASPLVSCVQSELLVNG